MNKTQFFLTTALFHLFTLSAQTSGKHLADENDFLQKHIDFSRPADKAIEEELLRPPAEAYPFPAVKTDFSSGMPSIQCGGKPAGFVSYAVMSRSGGNLLSARELREAGVDLFLVDLGLTDNTYGDQPRDASPEKMFERFKVNAEALLKSAPDAKILIRLWASFEGDDFQTLYPDALLAEPSGNTLWRDKVRRANYLNEWRLYVAARLRKFLERVGESNYAPHVAGVYIGAMHTGEWWFWKDGHFLWDYSKTRREAFRMYLEMKYGKENFPELKKRWNVTTDEELFRLPTREERKAFPFQPCSRMADYMQVLNLPVTNAAKYWAKVIKAVSSGRLLAGMEIMSDLNTMNVNGTVFVNQLMDCPEIDFLGAPSPYGLRAPGGFSPARAADGSLALHGKFFFSEDDMRTHVTYGTAAGQGSPPPTPREAAQLMRRQGLSAMLKGYRPYLMEFGGRWFTHPEIRKEIRTLNLLFPVLREMKLPRNPEIALVSDQESQLYGNYFANPSAFRYNVSPFIGADHDFYELRDFLKPGVSGKYKLVIFLNLKALSESERAGIDKLKSGGRTLLFFHDPGRTDLTHPQSDWTDNLSRLTGIKLEPRKASAPWGRVELTADLKNMKREFGAAADSLSSMAGAMQIPDASISPSDSVDTKTMPGGNNLFPVAVADPDAVILGRTPDGAGRFALKRFPGWTSVYSATCLLPAPVVREIARMTGCHLYNRNGDAVFQRGPFAAVHTASDGQHEVLFKSDGKVLDFYEGTILSPVNNRIVFHARKGETKLFYQGDIERFQAEFAKAEKHFDSALDKFTAASPAPPAGRNWYNYVLNNRRPKPWNYGPFPISSFVPGAMVFAGPFDSARELYALAESVKEVKRALREGPLPEQSESLASPLALLRRIPGKDGRELSWEAYHTGVWNLLSGFGISKGQCGLIAFYLHCDAPKRLELLFASDSDARLCIDGKTPQGKEGKVGRILEFPAGDTLFVIAAENPAGSNGFTVKLFEPVEESPRPDRPAYPSVNPKGVSVRLAPTGYHAKLVDRITPIPLAAAPKGTEFTLLPGKNRLSLQEKIRVKPGVDYFLKTECAPSGDGRGIVYAGFLCFDKDGKQIRPQEVVTEAGSETVLAADAAAGDSFLRVKDASHWKLSGPPKYIAFNAKSDRGDLPNRSVIPITGVKKAGEEWVVALKQPLREAFRKGTAVRLHTLASEFTLAGARSYAGDKSFTLNARTGNLYPGTDSFIPYIFGNFTGQLKLSGIEFGTIEKSVE